MARKDEIKVYNEKEDIVADYDNFRKDWEYDRDKMGGIHKSGLKIYRTYAYPYKIRMDNMVEWMTKMKDEGLNRDEVNAYLCMIEDQLMTITEKEPKIEKELTLEEKVAEMEKINKENIELAKKYNHIDEAKVKELKKNFEKFKEQYRKNWGGKKRTGHWK